MKVNIFIQARMSSSRFPGKVLAPVKGIPLIKYLIDSTVKVKNRSQIVVLTSNEVSDCPLVAFLKSIDCPVFRGSLDNVFDRFYNALDTYPCDYLVRLCADSPFIDHHLIEFMIKKGVVGDYDLVSNVFSRKFPKGQSVEMIRSSVFKDIQNDQLSNEEKEHVTPYFYRNRDKYKCLFFEHSKDLSTINQCIDTLEDLREIEMKRYQYVFEESQICSLG